MTHNICVALHPSTNACCTLDAGHDVWHLDSNGDRWYDETTTVPEPPVPSDQEQLHISFYKLAVAQRDSAWREIRSLKTTATEKDREMIHLRQVFNSCSQQKKFQRDELKNLRATHSPAVKIAKVKMTPAECNDAEKFADELEHTRDGCDRTERGAFIIRGAVAHIRELTLFLNEAVNRAEWAEHVRDKEKAHLTERVESAEAERDAAEKRASSWTGATMKEQARAESAEAERDTWRRRAGELSEELDAIETERDELRDQRNAADAEVGFWKTNSKRLMAQLGALVIEVEDNSGAELLAVESQNELKARIADLTAERDEAIRSRNAHKLGRRDCREEYGELQAERDKLEERVAELEDTNTDLRSDGWGNYLCKRHYDNTEPDNCAACVAVAKLRAHSAGEVPEYFARRLEEMAEAKYGDDAATPVWSKIERDALRCGAANVRIMGSKLATAPTPATVLCGGTDTAHLRKTIADWDGDFDDDPNSDNSVLGALARAIIEPLSPVCAAIAALEPFSRMARDDRDTTEIACVRGVASDMTVLTSGDFQTAKEVLAALSPKLREISEVKKCSG